MTYFRTTTAMVTAALLSVSGAVFAEGNNYEGTPSQQMNDRSRDYNTSQDNQEWHGGEYGAIDKLPEEGNVTLSGTVADTDNEDNSFTLEDSTGETIDVHTEQRVTLNEGDRVRVSGVMEDEALGMGEQIVSASVQRIGTR